MTWYLVDGMDGSGKSTVADELKRLLEARGRRVMMFTHPSEVTVPGRLSARFLTKTGKAATILSTGFYVMDALRSIASMRINRRKYDDVIFVRYIMAVAYMPEKHYEKLYRDIEKILPMPEVNIFVDIDAETAMQRILSRGEELEMFETVDQLADTRRKILHLADDKWIIISNSGELSETFRQLEEGVFHARPGVPGRADPREGQSGQVHLPAHLPAVHGHHRLRRHIDMAGRRDDVRHHFRHRDHDGHGPPARHLALLRQEGEGHRRVRGHTQQPRPPGAHGAHHLRVPAGGHPPLPGGLPRRILPVHGVLCLQHPLRPRS